MQCTNLERTFCRAREMLIPPPPPPPPWLKQNMSRWSVNSTKPSWPFMVTPKPISIYIQVPLWRGAIYHDITYNNTMTGAKHKAFFEITTHTPYQGVSKFKHFQLYCGLSLAYDACQKQLICQISAKSVWVWFPPSRILRFWPGDSKNAKFNVQKKKKKSKLS